MECICGMTNPLDVSEQITYLMFIHDIDEADTRYRFMQEWIFPFIKGATHQQGQHLFEIIRG